MIPPPPSVNFNPRAPCGARPQLGDNVATNLQFQSTRPVRGATPAGGSHRQTPGISIHAPRAGRDKVALVEASANGISIHAPRAGRDVVFGNLSAWLRNFNPRAPCGARRKIFSKTHFKTNFNPRAPCGARLEKLCITFIKRLISIHAPRAGRDSALCVCKEGILISIHAPRAGRDHPNHG